MKLLFSNSQYSYTSPTIKRQTLEQNKIKKYKIQESSEKSNLNRPAQATSFGGSIVSVGEKFINSFIESKAINNLISVVKGNEAAFNAGYALIVAGMMKPGLVLAQTGFNDKDGQMIATKNFLQAFIGFFLGLTIGGGFVKKIWDSMETNFRLLKVKEFDNGAIKIRPRKADDDSVREVAKEVLIKEKTKFKYKHQYAMDFADEKIGFERLKEYIKRYKEYKYKPQAEEIDKKAALLIRKLRKDHIDIFNKNDYTKQFCAKLIKNLELLTADPSGAKTNIPNGLKSHIWDSFESVNKNITNVPTVIAKAKISSLLLPTVVAAIFANRVMNSKKNSQNNSKINSEKSENSSTINKKDNNLSFKGKIIDNALTKSTRVFEKLALSNFGQSFTNFTSKISPTPSRMMSQIESFGITFYWLLNTHFSKKIDPDQKLGLNVHTALVTLVSCVASIVLDSATDIIINKAENAYGKKLKESAMDTLGNWKDTQDYKYMTKIAQDKNIKEASEEMTTAVQTAKNIAKEIVSKCDKLYNVSGIEKQFALPKSLVSEQEILKSASNLTAIYGKHLKKFKSLTIFTLVVRFLVPVLTVKQSKKIKKALIEFSKNRTKNKETNIN